MAVKKRRQPPRTYTQYTRYKKWLREDFEYTCTYCEIHENLHGGYHHFHIDHYRPKSIFKDLVNEYNNLIYSCDICNRMKSDAWPSDNPLDDGIGWIDPCEHDLREHFLYDSSNGNTELVYITRVGKWMALNLAMDHPARIKYHEYCVQIEQTLNDNISECEELYAYIEQEYKETKSKNLEKALRIISTMIERNKKQLEMLFVPRTFQVISKL